MANQNKAFGISMRDGLVSDFKAGWNEVLRTGAKGSDVLRGIVINSLTKLSDHYLDKAVDGLLKGATGEGLANFFQKLGDDAGGAFVDAVKAGWDIIKSLFSGLADMLSNAFSSSGSGGSGGGGWLSAIGSLFSDGGGYATGGLINGPGTDTSDSIVARLSRGEFVLKASAVRGLGVGAVQYMNTHGRLPKHAFASGGGFALPSMGSGGGGMTNNYWQNMVHIDSAHMLEALKREPGFNRHITGVVGDNKKAIQGAWG